MIGPNGPNCKGLRPEKRAEADEGSERLEATDPHHAGLGWASSAPARMNRQDAKKSGRMDPIESFPFGFLSRSSWRPRRLGG